MESYRRYIPQAGSAVYICHRLGINPTPYFEEIAATARPQTKNQLPLPAWYWKYLLDLFLLVSGCWRTFLSLSSSLLYSPSEIVLFLSQDLYSLRQGCLLLLPFF